MSDPNYDEIRQRVEKRFKERQAFFIHFSVYVVINLMFWGLWFLMSQAPDAAPVPVGGGFAPDEIEFVMFPWPLIITFGWGIGLVAHFLTYYYQHGPGREQRESAIQREVERELARRKAEGYLEKPKRDRRLQLTDEGELEEAADEEVDYRRERDGR